MKNKHIPDCDKCGKQGVYYEKYDSYFCEDCNVWLEDTCEGLDCRFCVSRPDKPCGE